MSDIDFANSLIVKAPRDGAPDYVKASISIKPNHTQRMIMDAKELGQQAAFPVSDEVERDALISGYGSVGLTKREAFAMTAMQGLLGCRNIPELTDEDTIASLAVEHADALLAALAQPRQGD